MADETPVLDLNPPQGQTLDLFPKKDVVTYNDDYSKTKANRFAVVLGPNNPGTDVINNTIAMGDQAQFQYLLKQNEDISNSLARQSVIRQVAERSGGNPTVDDIAIVQHLSNDELHSADLNTILEKKYSDYFTNTVSSVPSNVVFPKAADENEDQAVDILNGAARTQERSLIAQDKFEEISKRYDAASWFGAKGWSFAAGMIPGWAYYQNHNRIDTGQTMSLTQGANLQEQIAYLYTLPPDQFKATLDKAVNEMAEVDIGQAMQFAQAVVSLTSDEMFLRNTFDVVDALGVAGLAKDVLKSGTALSRGMVKAGKAVVNNPEDLSKSAATAGLNADAAKSNLAKSIQSGDLSGASVLSKAEDLEERLPTVLSPQKGFLDTDTTSPTAVNRLHETVARGSEISQRILTGREGIDVLEPGQVVARADEAFDQVKDTFSSIQDHVIDMKFDTVSGPRPFSISPAEENAILNRPSINIRMGERDGTLFETAERAEKFAKDFIKIKTDDYTIDQDGLGGWFINVKKTLGADGDFRNLQIETSLQSPNTVANKLIGGARSPDYVLPQQNVQARGRMLHGSEYMGREIRDLTETFRPLKKYSKEALAKVMNLNRAQKKYYKTFDEFNAGFLQANGRAASLDETDAYFRWKEFNDLDYQIRDADLVKQMIDAKGENFSFRWINDKKEPITHTFQGVEVQQLPWDKTSDFRLTAVRDGNTMFDTNSRFLKSRLDEIEKMIRDEGFRIINEGGNNRYFLVKDFKRNNIKPGILPYKEGGHNEPAYNYFIKQGDFTKDSRNVRYYNGDKALFLAPTREDSVKIAEAFEKARQLVKAGDPSAKSFITNNLPITYADFIKKVKTGAIDIDAPIMAVRKGERTNAIRDYSRDFDLYSEGVESEHNPFASVGGRYLQQKSDVPIDVFRAENNVIVKTDLDPYLNPWDTLRNATANMMDLKQTQDYITKSSLDYFQEFSHLLSVDKNRAAANPMYYLMNPHYKQGADAGQVRIAENVRKAISSFLQHRSPDEAAQQAWKEKILDKVFNTFGEEGWLGRKAWDDRYLWSAQDIQSFLRSATFNMKLGFFNPKQLFLQSAQAANVLALSPKAGVSGARAFPFLRMALMTENDTVLKSIAKKFKNIHGWDQKEFLDMVSAFKDSGFATVGTDIGLLDDIRPVTMRSAGVVGKFKEYHTAFYNEGERIARGMAYATAYREFLNKNPGAQIDRFARTQILQRAKDMTGNMTRDSNAAWQRGAAGLATQFMGYQARMMEALWDGGFLRAGRKFSAREKAQLLVGMSAMYGVPIIGSASLGYDLRDQLKQWLTNENVPFDGPMMDAYLNGIFPTMFNAMTGMDTDFASTYGPNGLPTLSKLLEGDLTATELFGGAAGTTGYNVITSLIPAARGIADAINNPNQDSVFPVLVEDLIGPLKNISTVQSASKVWEAINTHRWMSNSGNYVTNTTIPEAVVSAILGANPLRVSESYNKMSAIKGTKEAISAAQREVQSWTDKAISATKRGDIDSARVYYSRAYAVQIREGLSFKDYLAAKQRAFDANPFDESMEEQFQKVVVDHLNRKRSLNQLKGQ